jgi:tetratricopeptide (TPR) repeat protein
MRLLLLTLSMLLTYSLAYGKEYGNYDPKRMLTVSESPSGKKFGIDGKYLDLILSDLAFHAKNYPPKFDTLQDRQRATRDIKILSGILDILISEPNPNPEFLWRAGLLNSMGYNLDISGSAEKTSAIFQKMLAASPSDPRGNYMYGTFLAGSGKAKQAIPYLEKALAVGVMDSAYTLGMTYLALGDRQKALFNLENYRRHHQGDTEIEKLVDTLKNGEVRFKRSQN